MIVFSVWRFFLIGHVPSAHSFFKKKSIFENAAKTLPINDLGLLSNLQKITCLILRNLFGLYLFSHQSCATGTLLLQKEIYLRKYRQIFTNLFFNAYQTVRRIFRRMSRHWRKITKSGNPSVRGNLQGLHNYSITN